MNLAVSGCIVMYKNDVEMLKKAITSFLSTGLKVKLYLVDNSPTDDLKVLGIGDNIKYIHNPSNPGFGAAHNIAIKEALCEKAKYHFVINPDVYFKGEIIDSMVNYMHEDTKIGMMMPQVLNEDGSVQNLPKLLPSVYSVLMRKLKRPALVYENFINKYELRFVPKDKIYNAPILSGCFTLLNLEAIKEVGMYDDNFFMYFEDWDLSRRMHQKYKTIYFPKVSVYHEYNSGANKSSRLFKIFMNSAITYFNKWGWLIDSDRKCINEKALSQFK
ncbi:glycosyltransferase [Flavobacterium sp. 1355]|uniref:glycosyltransferase n=1 Tax=Flavobacterium sp. 1355 TaxID=2806571 RepID=UPI001AE6939B|nr:glycosyltransferase family 2 protein [Flavobacterium sp. 1355]MBP1224029.1 GT2 family glycosyltransferase [Flavobacterium sp. 1355]